MQGQRRQRGFTLGEVLTTLGVVGLGLSLAVPALSGLVQQNQGATAMNALVATLHIARSEAITRNRPVSVCPSADGEHCDGEAWEQGWIAFQDADADTTRAPGEALIDRANALPGQQLRSSEFAGGLRFAPNGRALTRTGATDGGEFALCAAGEATSTRVLVVRGNGLPAVGERRRDGTPIRCQPS
jgi:type IV fimbrial biogenesis protein FimT